jgi:hypothetical protein
MRQRKKVSNQVLQIESIRSLRKSLRILGRTCRECFSYLCSPSPYYLNFLQPVRVGGLVLLFFLPALLMSFFVTSYYRFSSCSLFHSFQESSMHSTHIIYIPGTSASESISYESIFRPIIYFISLALYKSPVAKRQSHIKAPYKS